VRLPPLQAWLALVEGDGHAAALLTTGGEFETTNRSAGRFRRQRLFAAISALASRFIVAVLPLW
jgi:hypothetical protein